MPINPIEGATSASRRKTSTLVLRDWLISCISCVSIFSIVSALVPSMIREIVLRKNVRQKVNYLFFLKQECHFLYYIELNARIFSQACEFFADLGANSSIHSDKLRASSFNLKEIIVTAKVPKKTNKMAGML